MGEVNHGSLRKIFVERQDDTISALFFKLPHENANTSKQMNTDRLILVGPVD